MMVLGIYGDGGSSTDIYKLNPGGTGVWTPQGAGIHNWYGIWAILK